MLAQDVLLSQLACKHREAKQLHDDQTMADAVLYSVAWVVAQGTDI
jgi:hypothetical protein